VLLDHVQDGLHRGRGTVVAAGRMQECKNARMQECNKIRALRILGILKRDKSKIAE
jgi:hypothetical protein